MDLAITNTIIKNQGSAYSSSFYQHPSSSHKNKMSRRSKGTAAETINNQQQQQQYYDQGINATTMQQQNLLKELEMDSLAQLDKEDSFDRQQAIYRLILTANAKLNSVINNEQIKRPDKVCVKVFLNFLKIGEIDNIKERFGASAYYEAAWVDNSVDPKQSFDPSRYWHPDLFIENAIGNLKQEIRHKVERRGNQTIIREMRTIKGLFWERLELWDFPLDIQELSITITSARDQSELYFEADQDNESTINTEDFQQQQEWNLYSHVETSKKYIHDVWNNFDRPCFTVTSTVSRRPGYFIYNAYMLIFFISVLGFVPFSFLPTAPHFRIQTTCLLILSSVNFRWIVTQKLPTVSYLTTLDKYAIFALVSLVLLCVWHAIIGSDLFLKVSQRHNIDIYAALSIGSMYVLFHIVYIIYFIVKYQRYKSIGHKKPNEEDANATAAADAATAPAPASTTTPDKTNIASVNFNINNGMQIIPNQLSTTPSSEVNIMGSVMPEKVVILSRQQSQQQQQPSTPTGSKRNLSSK